MSNVENLGFLAGTKHHTWGLKTWRVDDIIHHNRHHSISDHQHSRQRQDCAGSVRRGIFRLFAIKVAVFTDQGGCEKHAEAIISQIADSVAQAECRDKGKVKAEMLETISMSIARSVAKAVMRRQPRPRQAQICTESSTFLSEIAVLEEPMEDD